MVKKEISMDTGEVMDMFRDCLSEMSGDDITFIFNKEFARPGEQLVYKEDSMFVLEVPKNE